jgi:hypothetical protein
MSLTVPGRSVRGSVSCSTTSFPTPILNSCRSGCPRPTAAG